MQAAGWGSEGDPRGTYAGAFHSEGSGAGTLGKARAAAGRPRWATVPSHPVPDPGRWRAAGRPVPRPAPTSRAVSGAPGGLRVRPGLRGQGPGAARCRGEKPAGSPRPSRPFPAPPCGLRSFGGSPDSAEKCANRHTKKEDVNYCPGRTGGSVSSLKKKKIKAKLRLKNFFTFHLKFVFNRASCRFVPQPEAQAVPTQPQSSRRAPLGVGVAPARPPASFSPWGPSCPSCGAEDRAGRKNERVFRVWDPQVHWHPGTIPPTPAHSSGL